MASHAQRFDGRQNMKTRSFEVFHYKDKKPPDIGMHHHDFFEVYLFLTGDVHYRVEGRSYVLEPGDILLINPMELHQATIGTDKDYERLVLWIDRNYLYQLSGEDHCLVRCFDTQAPGHTNLLRPSRGRRAALQDLMEKLTREAYSSALGNEIYAQGLLMQFLVEINRLLPSQNEKHSQQEPDLIGQVLTYISNHYTDNLTLEHLAKEFFVSKYYLSHEFSRRMGTSIYRYILFRRLMQAREMMAAGSPPVSVYQSCGFGDYANFYRAFKNEYGISPKAFYHAQ